MHYSYPLVLEIVKQGEGLKMSLFGQEEIASTLRHYSQCTVSFLEINKLCLEEISILNKAGKTGTLEQDSLKNLKKTGQLLWDHLLTRSTRNKLKSSQNSDLIISIDEELVGIPWELLYDGNNFLCLSFNIGRVVRTKEDSSYIRYRSFSNILKMLVLANPTNDLKSAYLEGLNIKNQFDRKRNSVRIDFKSTNIDKLYIKKNLCDYDIVHFAGHCEYDSDDPKNSGWVLSDARFAASDILAMGSTVSLPSLVFSNACYSAKVSLDLIEKDCQEKSYSLASAFLFSGVRHYLGAMRKIEDPVSLAFSKEFYSQLLCGKSMGECVRQSRLSLIKEYGITAISWTSYLLYGDPSFVLFKLKAKPQAAKPKSDFLLKKQYRSMIFWLFSLLSVIALCVCLYIWLPTLNPNSYLLFSKSQEFYLKGNNQEVILLCNRIIKKDPAFLKVYPLLADAYQRMGDRENALKYYFDYALYAEKRQDKKHLASAYIGIGWLNHLKGDYQKAPDFYNKAIKLSRENKDRLNEAIALRKLAVWHIDKGDDAKALELLTKSSEINRERLYSYEHRYNLACDYFDMGLVFVNKDDLSAAKEFYAKSQQVFEKMKIKNELSDYWFNLGEIYLFERQYQKALDYYLRGLKIDQAQGNISNLVSDYDMIGALYLEMDNLPEAENFFKQSLVICQRITAPLECASVNYNLGVLYKKKGQKSKAKECLRQAQEIYSRINALEYEKVKQEILGLDNM